jgi:hypothetical protein
MTKLEKMIDSIMTQGIAVLMIALVLGFTLAGLGIIQL